MTRTKIKKLLKSEIATDTDMLNRYNALKEQLKPFNGKEINGNSFGRNKVKGFTFYRLEHNQDGKLRNTNSMLADFSINIGTDGTLFDFDNIDKINYSYSESTVHRINKLQPFIDDNAKFDDMIKRFLKVRRCYNKLIESLKDVNCGGLESFEFPIHYTILNEIMPNEITNNLIKYTQ